MGKKKKKKRKGGKRAETRDVRSVDVDIEGLHAYQYCLSREEQKKLEVTEEKMNKDLDGRLIYWVKDLNREDDDLDYVEPFPVVLKRNMTVRQIEELVLKGHSEAGVDWPEDRNLRLVLGHNRLQRGTTLAEYPLDREASTWSKPYGGVIWINENHVDTKKDRKESGHRYRPAIHEAPKEGYLQGHREEGTAESLLSALR